MVPLDRRLRNKNIWDAPSKAIQEAREVISRHAYNRPLDVNAKIEDTFSQLLKRLT